MTKESAGFCVYALASQDRVTLSYLLPHIGSSPSIPSWSPDICNDMAECRAVTLCLITCSPKRKKLFFSTQHILICRLYCKVPSVLAPIRNNHKNIKPPLTTLHKSRQKPTTVAKLLENILFTILYGYKVMK